MRENSPKIIVAPVASSANSSAETIGRKTQEIAALSLFLSQKIDRFQRILSHQILSGNFGSKICDGWFSWSPICFRLDVVCCLLDKVHYIKVGLKVM